MIGLANSANSASQVVKLSGLDVKKVCTLYVSGVNIRAIALRFHCRARRISLILRAAGYNPAAMRAIRMATTQRGNPKYGSHRAKKLHSVSPEHAAYIAGIFDGEGSLCFSRRYRHYRLAIGQNGHMLHDWLLATLGVGVVKPANPKPNHFQYVISAQYEVFQFLNLVVPYLIVKRVDALTALHLYKERYRWV